MVLLLHPMLQGGLRISGRCGNNSSAFTTLQLRDQSHIQGSTPCSNSHPTHLWRQRKADLDPWTLGLWPKSAHCSSHCSLGYQNNTTLRAGAAVGVHFYNTPPLLYQCHRFEPSRAQDFTGMCKDSVIQMVFCRELDIGGDLHPQRMLQYV